MLAKLVKKTISVLILKTDQEKKLQPKLGKYKIEIQYVNKCELKLQMEPEYEQRETIVLRIF